ncbi:MAG: succinoglycan biosynthesis protein EXOI [Alphaproteobacteria bacterium]|nr:MAG: succinoglycan biosynthesis protein EXOI [Caulobacteraceae bacterium]TPW06631.1 MAG: succinoglycan biosynthesis protein EXOI [Alphaproteobacteria bacterium]
MIAGAALTVVVAGACQPEPASRRVARNELVGIASVIDGDTIDIHGERIRLSGFDAPEEGRRCTDAAGAAVRVHQTTSLALSDFIGARTVSCARAGKDNHGRTVATCSVGEVDLGSWMVENGHARDWPKYSHGKYAPQEARARAARRGIWGMACPGLFDGRSLR